ncbi:MAG: radical SAM protein [Thermoanaerobaculia bacterium]
MPSRIASRALALAQPLAAHLELTYYCNWRCVFCYNPRHFDPERLSLNDWIPVLDDLRQLGTISLTLTGGEPLMHPEFFGIATAARRRAFAVRIFTNGTLIDDCAADAIAELFPSAVEMSLHGATAETHEKATLKPGSFARMFEAVERLRTRSVRLYLKSPVTSINEHEIDQMIALANSHGLPLRFDATITPRDDGSRAPLAYTASLKTRRNLLRMGLETGSVVTGERKQGDVNCGLGRTTLAIDPGGNVYPCIQWRHQALGNVRKIRLARLWPDSPVRQHSARVSEDANEMLYNLGGSASRFPFCPALALQASGDALTPDPDFLEKTSIVEVLEEESSTGQAQAV